MRDVDFHTIAHWGRLDPDVRQELAERFGLAEPGETAARHSAAWLLRANERGLGSEIGRAVQLAPQ